MREAAAAHITQTIRPAMQRLAELLRRELAPLARPDDRVGIREVPGGEAGYLAAVARHTTTTLSPEDIHAIGLAELDELAGLWSQIGQEALGESDFATIAARMRDDPALRFRTREEIIAVAQDALDRAEAVRDTYFEHYDIPACVIEEINPIDADNTAMAYYRPPAVDGSRPGAHCLLTTNPGERYRYEYEALAFHESVPGHHLQLATAQTLDIPRYRRHIDAELCAFNEGWGLYAERLADEIGLYSSPIARLGMLSFASLRACRLVVDTGMHHLGWSRQQAIDFMYDHTATTRDNVRNEVDRYIAWPGQALAYVTGKREIVRLRERAQHALGPRFELRRFHHAVLRNGAIPLTVLDDEIERWTATGGMSMKVTINGCELNVEVHGARGRPGADRPPRRRRDRLAGRAQGHLRPAVRPVPCRRLRRARLRTQRGRAAVLPRPVGRRRRRPAPVDRRGQDRHRGRLVRRVHRPGVRRGLPRACPGDRAARHLRRRGTT